MSQANSEHGQVTQTCMYPEMVTGDGADGTQIANCMDELVPLITSALRNLLQQNQTCFLDKGSDSQDNQD